MRALLALSILLLLAGCIGPSEPPNPAPSEPRPVPPVLAAAAPLTFGAPVKVASSGPALYLNSLAEASVAVLPDGTVLVTASGCDKGAPHAGDEEIDLCWHSPVYRSQDGGGTWSRLNQGADSHLAKEAPAAISDSILRADDAGHLYYLSMQRGGLLLLRSEDGGDSWHTIPAPPASSERDRPWMDAVGDGQLAAAWHEAGTIKASTSLDGGATWSKAVTIVGDVISYGQPRIVPASGDIFLPYLAQPAGTPLKLARGSLTGGPWTTLDTGIVLPAPAAVGPRATGSPGHIQSFPGLAVGPTGTLLLTWDQEGHGTVVSMARGYAAVMASLSVDDGVAWSEPVEVGNSFTSLMPWVEALPSGQFAIAHYASDTPGDPDYVGSWRFEVARLAETPKGLKVLDRAVVDDEVRLAGGICSAGGDCLFKASDRSLLDINEMTVAADGALFVAYGADDMAAGKASTIRFATTAR